MRYRARERIIFVPGTSSEMPRHLAASNALRASRPPLLCVRVCTCAFDVRGYNMALVSQMNIATHAQNNIVVWRKKEITIIHAIKN